LQYEGLNQIDAPRGSKVVAVTEVTFNPGVPAIVFLAERDAQLEPRHFYVTYGSLPSDGDTIKLGAYVGHMKPSGALPWHVFEAKVEQ